MKHIIYGKEARTGLKKGLDKVANAVKVTMGAMGLPVAIDQPFHKPLVTKDGVKVAESIILEDPLENMGANMIIEAASLTNKDKGDGTSATSVLTQAIVTKGMKVLEDKGVPFYEFKKGMEYASELIKENLKKNSFSIKEDTKSIYAIPTISANNDKEIGKLLADTFLEVGEYGYISVEESKTGKNYTEISKGLKFKMAPESQYFYDDTIKKLSNLTNSKVLLYIGRIETESEILPAINISVKENKHLLVICNEISPLLLSRLVSAKLKGDIKITVIQSPYFGEIRHEAMEDISLMSGARLFLQEKDDDISTITEEDLGVVEKILIDDEYTSFINSAANEKIEAKAQQLIELEDTSEEVKERIARLKGGVARIYVGGASEMEMRETRDRVVDAVNALSVAYKDGVIIGGGIALLNASKDLKIPSEATKGFIKGMETIIEAVKAPANQILKNAGYKKQQRKDILSKLNTPTQGYNVLTGEYVDMFENGILDPLGVTQSALKNATSVAGVFLSTEAVILDTSNYTTKDIKFGDGI